MTVRFHRKPRSGSSRRQLWSLLWLWLGVACTSPHETPARDASVDDDASAAEASAAGAPAAVGRRLSLASVWGAASDDVWAVGASGAMLHFDGRQWSWLEPLTQADLLGVHGAASDDVWAVGDDVVLHWDGSAWSTVLQGVAETWIRVWPADRDDVWMVGMTWDNDVGVIRHWDGNRWEWTEVPPALSLWDVWCGAAGDVWVAGSSTTQSGFLARGQDEKFATWGFDGPALRAIWGSASDDLWTAPYLGSLQHWDGSTWSSYAAGPEGAHFRALSGTSSEDVWGVGNDGLIVHWNGDAWTAQPALTDRPLASVWALSPDDVWAVGGALLHWDGERWRAASAP